MTQQDDAAELATHLAALREELKLKAHLAGMDAKAEWQEELRPKLQDLEARLRQGAGEARVKLHLGLMELRDAWNAVEPRLRDLVDKVQDDGARLRELFEKAREGLEQASAEADAETE